jgi:hypothetical protein
VIGIERSRIALGQGGTMAKTAQPRLSKAEILAHRDMQLRGGCIPIAMQCGAKDVDDMLRGADKIYNWIKAQVLPSADALNEALTEAARAEAVRTGHVSPNAAIQGGR